MGARTVIGRDPARRLVARYFAEPVARLLHTLKLTPNAVTILGLVTSLGAAYLAAVGLLLPAGLVLLAASALDMLDGALARLTGQESRFGALLDSASDRLAEAAVLLGILVFYLNDDSTAEVVLAFLVLVASFMVSYLRARGEGLGIRSNVGIMTRPERVIVLAFGMVVDQVLAALAIILLLSVFTAGQRFHHLWRETRKKNSIDHSGG